MALCKACNGAKKLMALGMMLNTCKHCAGTGFEKEVAAVAAKVSKVKKQGSDDGKSQGKEQA